VELVHLNFAELNDLSANKPSKATLLEKETATSGPCFSHKQGERTERQATYIFSLSR
jgi:hypothetical protein